LKQRSGFLSNAQAELKNTVAYKRVEVMVSFKVTQERVYECTIADLVYLSVSGENLVGA